MKISKQELEERNLRSSKKGLIFLSALVFGILLFAQVVDASSQSNLDSGIQGKNFTIIQVCKDATYITIDGILYPDKVFKEINENMTKVGSGTFIYNLTTTTMLGEYDVTETTDGCEENMAYRFWITPSGDSGSDNIAYFIFFFILAYGIGFVGFFGRNQIVSFIGGTVMILFGLYIMNSGIIVFRDSYTIALSYLTLFLGATFMLVPTIEYIQDNFL